MKDMYCKPTNRTEHSIPMHKKSSVPTQYKPKMVLEREITRMSPNSQIKNLLLLSRSTATTHVLR